MIVVALLHALEHVLALELDALLVEARLFQHREEEIEALVEGRRRAVEVRDRLEVATAAAEVGGEEVQFLVERGSVELARAAAAQHAPRQAGDARLHARHEGAAADADFHVDEREAVVLGDDDTDAGGEGVLEVLRVRDVEAQLRVFELLRSRGDLSGFGGRLSCRRAARESERGGDEQDQDDDRPAHHSPPSADSSSAIRCWTFSTR